MQKIRWVSALAAVFSSFSSLAEVTSSTSYDGYSISVQSAFGGYQSLVDRDATDGEPAYDYSVNVIRTDENNGNLHRAFTGGRWKERVNGIDGDHILQWTSSDGSPDTWSMTRSGPEFLQGHEEGSPDEWWSSNVMDAEVVKAEDDKWIMMVQCQITQGLPIDIQGMTANSSADRILLLTADSLDGAWTRMTSRGVVTNITDPTNIMFHHHELIYVPWDPDGKKYWLYFCLNESDMFKGIYRIRSADYTTFDFAAKQRTVGTVGIGNQLAYMKEAPGGPVFVRITSTSNDESGRKVPALQLSSDGLNWNHPSELKLEGSSDAMNQNCYFSGIATYLGRGNLQYIGNNLWQAVYATTTSGSPVQPEIWTSEIGVGTLTMSVTVPPPATPILGTDFEAIGTYDEVNLDHDFSAAGIRVSPWNVLGEAFEGEATGTDADGFSGTRVARLDGPNLSGGPDFAESVNFTVSVDASAILSLADLTFQWRGASTSLNRGLVVQLQVGAGAPVEIYNQMGALRPEITSNGLPIDLSAPQYQGLSDTTLTFSFAAYGEGSGAIEIGGIELSGLISHEVTSSGIAFAISGGSHLMVSVTDMDVFSLYTLECIESLTSTNSSWVDLAYATGVTSVEWMIPLTNDALFVRVIAE